MDAPSTLPENSPLAPDEASSSKDVIAYSIAMTVTVVAAVGIYFWWASFGPATSALPPLQPGEIASYTYEVKENQPGACRPGNRWDDCTFLILRNGQSMWTIEGMDIPQHLGGGPLKWLDDKTLITSAQTRSGSDITTDNFYLYHPETNTKEFYYKTIESRKTGPTILGSWYLYNFGENEYDYAVWLYRSTDGKAIAHIASRPSVNESWCPSLTEGISADLEKCFLSITPYVTPAVGPLETNDASQYSLSFERNTDFATLHVKGPSEERMFRLDLSKPEVNY
jgi:hypothetical protein